ncbi:MAG: hypothetical protein S0880_11955 [Actinomycetota bacterium]|nr:hypothetical protein [Actinomycetota bacterium]
MLEEQDFEILRISWWLPDALVSGSVTQRQRPAEEVAALLDTFHAVDRETFEGAIAGAFVEVVRPDPPSEPDASTAEGEPVPAETLDRLLTFIEDQVGRTFEADVSAEILGRDALVDEVPAGTFVPEPLWDVLWSLGLVDGDDDDRLAADTVRREDLRGGCCPVRVRTTGDPAFDEIVLVHELTHLLDVELAA